MRTPSPLRHHLLFTVLLLGLFLLLAREYSVRPDGRLHVSFLDVGQGDSAYLLTPSGRQILIDGGPGATVLEGVGKRMSFFDRSIDLLVLSHGDLDHVGGLVDILRRYDVSLVLLPAVESDHPRYREFLALLQEKNIRVILADPLRDISLGDGVHLDVLWPEATFATDDINAASAVLNVTYGADSILFTGDIAEESESAIRATGADIDADILKVGHHGSRFSTSTGFLLDVSPDLAVISVGENTFGHPHPSILQRLAHFGIPVRITREEGAINLVLDGKVSP